jgi:BolA protein
MNRINLIRERLQQAFSPIQLEVIDDSHKHIGHAGAQGGAGHYTVTILADCFKNLSRVEAHRKIYDALDDLIPDQIHALRIKITHTSKV